jgi:hypothetical protein
MLIINILIVGIDRISGKTDLIVLTILENGVIKRKRIEFKITTKKEAIEFGLIFNKIQKIICSRGVNIDPTGNITPWWKWWVG